MNFLRNGEFTMLTINSDKNVIKSNWKWLSLESLTNKSLSRCLSDKTCTSTQTFNRIIISNSRETSFDSKLSGLMFHFRKWNVDLSSEQIAKSVFMWNSQTIFAYMFLTEGLRWEKLIDQKAQKNCYCRMLDKKLLTLSFPVGKLIKWRRLDVNILPKLILYKLPLCWQKSIMHSKRKILLNNKVLCKKGIEWNDIEADVCVCVCDKRGRRVFVAIQWEWMCLIYLSIFELD